MTSELIFAEIFGLKLVNATAHSINHMLQNLIENDKHIY